IEACLEIARRGLLVGLQDLGGAGLCCATSETAARGFVGLDVDLDAVPLREADMEPFEILTSESQERMLAIVRPEDVDEALDICRRWGVLASVVGTVKPGGNLTVHSRGEVVADIPAVSLADEGPTYNRPMRRPDWIDALQADDASKLEPPKDLADALLELLASPNICDKRWVYEQYDSIVQHNTLEGPGGDAALIRVEGTSRALALSTDGNGRYCQLDPRAGTMLATAEAARNVACSGARLLAVTNCLNFGNPEYPEVMWQFAESVAGLGEACIALQTPVTGGNVSFYNQTDDIQIHPTPVIGMLGILEDASVRLGIAWAPDQDIVLLGETKPELSGSEWAWIAHRHLGGTPPSLDLDAERRLCELLATLAEQRLAASAHDCADGGIAVTLAESAIASATGARIDPGEVAMAPHEWLFGESASRAIVTTTDAEAVLAAARAASVPAAVIGRTGGSTLQVGSWLMIDVSALASSFAGGLPGLMH
ncbi:MAG TPA: AIR synthase-related protein, partial [Actinomycetota bacterium]|nr:AIR synthase-related protein [Actinomycetota bacterium]